MNKIGFNLLAWSANVGEGVYPIIERLKRIGYDGVEALIGENTKQEFKKYGDFVRQAQLESTAVLVLGSSENPISPDKNSRNLALEKFKWAVDMSFEMNSKIICGPFHSAHSVFSRNAPTPEEYERSSEVLYQAGEYAKQANIVLALEAVNRFENYLCNTMEQLQFLVKKINHAHVKGMFDTHHANIEEKDNITAIHEIEDNLVHFHISENDRGTPGKGLVHWNEVFSILKKIKYEGWLTIEAFSRNDPGFANAINVWREYSDPWEVAEEGYTFIKENIVKK